MLWGYGAAELRLEVTNWGFGSSSGATANHVSFAFLLFENGDFLNMYHINLHKVQHEEFDKMVFEQRFGEVLGYLGANDPGFVKFLRLSPDVNQIESVLDEKKGLADFVPVDALIGSTGRRPGL